MEGPIAYLLRHRGGDGGPVGFTPLPLTGTGRSRPLTHRSMTMKKTTKNGITLYWSETLKAWVTIPED